MAGNFSQVTTDLIKQVPPIPDRLPVPGGILKKLKVSDDIRTIMAEHIKLVGLDHQRFTRRAEDQGKPSIFTFLVWAFYLTLLGR